LMSSPTRTKRFSRRSRLALGWAVGAFIIVEGLLCAAIEIEPMLRDPEFAQKLARLQRQRATHPDRPLILIVGSSRSSSGIQPSALALSAVRQGRPPLVFNMALTGYGPIQQVELLERFRRDGIHPDVILAEVHPLLLHQPPGLWGEEQWMRPESLDRRDLALVSDYMSEPRQWLWRWIIRRTIPAYWYRFPLLNCLSPGWLDTRLRQDGAWRDIDALGWLPLTCSLDSDAVKRRRRYAHDQYAPALHNFCITPAADRALRQFVAQSKASGAAVALFLMPEGKLFQSWYTASARAEIDAYLARLSREAGVRVFDATNWCAEGDFSDSHHLLCGASSRFSRRFAKEVVEPFLDLGPSENIDNREEPRERLSRAQH
jgi:hypothetical protein